MSATLRFDGDDGFPPFNRTAASNCDLFSTPLEAGRQGRTGPASATIKCRDAFSASTHNAEKLNAASVQPTRSGSTTLSDRGLRYVSAH